jgi:hypothetical protein
MVNKIDVPPLDVWLHMTSNEIAAFVSPHRLSIKLALDGTRRHYLMHHPSADGKVTDLIAYSLHCTNQYVRLCDMLFSFGVHTVMALNLWPPDINRREDNFLQLTLKMSEHALLHDDLLTMAARNNAAVRLHGDYDVSPHGEPIRAGLTALHETLARRTPYTERLLLFGFYTGRFEDETIARTVRLYERLQRPPTAQELQNDAFPDGPDRIDIFINSGWMRVDNWSFPPLLNQGKAELYSLIHLVLDMQEVTLRRILYDTLFVRRATSPADNLAYLPTTLNQLSEYYIEHRHCLVGTGELVGPDLWYPDHAHSEDSGQPYAEFPKSVLPPQ